MLLLRAIGQPVQRLRELVGRGLAKAGATPNALTLIGLPINIAAGALFAFGEFRWAVAVIFLACAFDMLDGTVARITGRATQAGAFLDSSVDRYNDAALFGGLIIWYLRTDQDLLAALAVSALVGSELISYARARAECFMDKCKVGFFERPERIVTLMLSAFFNQGRAAMWILGILTHYTVFVRMHFAVAELRAEGRRLKAEGTTERQASEQQASGSRLQASGTTEEAETTEEESDSSDRVFAHSYLYRLIFWDFDRGTLEFDIAAVVIAACAIWLPA